MSALPRNKWHEIAVWIQTGNPSIWETEAVGTQSQCCLHSQSEVKVCLGYVELRLKQTKIATKGCDLTAQRESLIKRLSTVHVVSSDFQVLGYFHILFFCFHTAILKSYWLLSTEDWLPVIRSNISKLRKGSPGVIVWGYRPSWWKSHRSGTVRQLVTFWPHLDRDSDVPPTPSFVFKPRLESKGQCYPHPWWVIPLQLNLSQNTPRSVFPWWSKSSPVGNED